jgi:phenylacetic acid degradation operon negative regulatory protein
LRKAATALHLAELREGVWIRPDNLDPQRLPTSRAVLDEQCTHFHHATTDITASTMRSVFSLDDWADTARWLVAAMDDDHGDATENFRYQFALSVAVVRQLVPADWPGGHVRSSYRRFDAVFKRRMNHAFRKPDV